MKLKRTFSGGKVLTLADCQTWQARYTGGDLVQIGLRGLGGEWFMLELERAELLRLGDELRRQGWSKGGAPNGSGEGR